MALYCQSMLLMAMELADKDPSQEIPPTSS
jgi:hypothetical protein